MLKAMWAVTPFQQPRPFFLLTSKPHQPSLSVVVSAAAPPPRHRSSRITDQKNKKQEQENKNQQEKTKGLTGLDVLWAMQRAAAEKSKVSGGGGGRNNKSKKGNESVSKGSQIEEVVTDSQVRQLCIKREWGSKLSELEKRLEDLSDIK